MEIVLSILAIILAAMVVGVVCFAFGALCTLVWTIVEMIGYYVGPRSKKGK